MSTVKGRFAPSPSGPLHLGNLACCLLAYLSARSRGGSFLLRIEDLDWQRCKRESGLEAIDVLRRFGFDWDEDPLFQSERYDVYASYLNRLQEGGHLYPCFCTRSELLASQAPNLGDTQTIYAGTCRGLGPEEAKRRSRLRNPALRLLVPDLDVAFTDRVQGPYLENLARDCGDFIVRRSDGMYGYQLAVVVDDGLSGVTEVVRGCDILSATPRQIYLAGLLDFPVPAYAHIPLLFTPDGRRLAKRDHALGLNTLLSRMGPEAILGMLAYAYGILDAPEPLTLKDLTGLFAWDRVSREAVRLPEGLA